MSDCDLSLVNIKVVSSVRKEVSLEVTKSNLVALYVSLSSVPTTAPSTSSFSYL